MMKTTRKIINDVERLVERQWDVLEWLCDAGYLNEDGERLKHKYWLKYVRAK